MNSPRHIWVTIHINFFWCELEVVNHKWIPFFILNRNQNVVVQKKIQLENHTLLIALHKYGNNSCLLYMIWYTRKIVCKTICINKIIDGGDNTDYSIDIIEIIHRNVRLNVVNKTTFEWHQNIRGSCIIYWWCGHRRGEKCLTELQHRSKYMSDMY